MVSFAGGIALAVLFRTALLAFMVRITESGYWGGVRISLVDRIYLVVVALGLTGYLVAGEYYLRRGRETKTLAYRSIRVFGVEFVILGLGLLALVLFSGFDTISTLGAAVAIVAGVGLTLIARKLR
ncbi:MAG: hypothetical protein EA426_19830 [Spirochaetaceae bacterium]|nr:MAG: hypothetical protein EA426_19830 [Spirochaetaceae bacterium]